MRNNYDEAFSCFKCKEIPDLPYESECCGKLYCKSCCEESSYLYCKLCKALLRYRVSVFAKNILGQIQTNCKYGCGLNFKYSQSKQHYLCCECKEYECSIRHCTFNGNLDQMKEHIQAKHIFEIVILNEYYSEFKPLLTQYCSTLDIAGQFYQSTKAKVNEMINHDLNYYGGIERPLNLRDIGNAVSPQLSKIDERITQKDSDYDNNEFDSYQLENEGNETQSFHAKSSSSSSKIIAESIKKSESNIRLTNEFTERINKINKDLAETIDSLKKPSIMRLGISSDQILETQSQLSCETDSNIKMRCHNQEILEEAKLCEDMKELDNLPYRI